jgi:hypothetical protein
MGYTATSLWWPATFPARPGSPVRTIPGLGAPDLLGRLGVGVLFTDNPDLHNPHWKTPVQVLQAAGKGRYTSFLQGPELKPGQFAQLDFSLETSAHKHRLVIGKQSFELQTGAWSPLIEVEFKLGFLFKVKAVTRALLAQTEPDLRLYMLPLQIHPLAAAWRYATPPGFVKGIWKDCGPYLTLGWPQDTTGLEEGHLNDAQFLALCESIFAGRECVLMQQLQSFNEGVLGILFDDLDRIQHMFRRDHPEVLEAWYQKLDALVGRVQQRLAAINPKARLLVLSDHGFSEFTYKVHLNRWLLDHGYLAQKPGNASPTDDALPASGSQASGLQNVDWTRSQAYAVGLNSLYLNLQGREGQGSLALEAIEPTLEKLKNELLAWQGPDGKPVLQRVLLKHEAFQGPLTPYGPDLVLGYAPGYRASSETGLGQWSAESISSNQDHWGADHCIDSLSVPGVIFSNLGLHGIEKPSYLDIPMLTIGKALKQSQSAPPPSIAAGEDQEKLEERLKSLGYL